MLPTSTRSITVRSYSDMIIYLYVKTHNKTGLKYLGKTKSKDPHKYKGSGNIWKEHILEHGYDVTTEILRECESNEELSKWGRFYSDLWDVVNNTGWANKITESGGGDYSGFSQKRLDAVTAKLKNVPKTEEHKLKLRGERGRNSKVRSGNNMSRNISATQKAAVSQALKDIPKSESHKSNISESMKLRCSCLACEKEVAAFILNNHYKKCH